MHITPCGVKLDTFEICMRKCVNITYTTIYPNCLLGLRYQHQVLELVRLQVIWILLPYQVTRTNGPWNTVHKTPLPKQSEFFMVSTLWCQLFGTLFYWERRTKFKQQNIIIDMASTNRCPLCGTYFYVNWRTNSNRKNIFVGMVTCFKNNWQRAIYVSTLCWN